MNNGALGHMNGYDGGVLAVSEMSITRTHSGSLGNLNDCTGIPSPIGSSDSSIVSSIRCA